MNFIKKLMKFLFKRNKKYIDYNGNDMYKVFKDKKLAAKFVEISNASRIFNNQIYKWKSEVNDLIGPDDIKTSMKIFNALYMNCIQMIIHSVRLSPEELQPLALKVSLYTINNPTLTDKQVTQYADKLFKQYFTILKNNETRPSYVG